VVLTIVVDSATEKSVCAMLSEIQLLRCAGRLEKRGEKVRGAGEIKYVVGESLWCETSTALPQMLGKQSKFSLSVCVGDVYIQ
jgi:hypothetical protein